MKHQLRMDMADEDDFEINYGIDWPKVIEMADRREAAKKQAVPCEKCGSIQVQLTDWSTDQLKLKCRSCKHKFERKLK